MDINNKPISNKKILSLAALAILVLLLKTYAFASAVYPDLAAFRAMAKPLQNTVVLQIYAHKQCGGIHQLNILKAEPTIRAHDSYDLYIHADIIKKSHLQYSECNIPSTELHLTRDLLNHEIYKTLQVKPGKYNIYLNYKYKGSVTIEKIYTIANSHYEP